MKVKKKYVDVIVRHTESKIIPLYVLWDDGRKFEIDRILEVKRAASIAGGGTGIRYKCIICGQVTYIWNDENQWFVEAKLK